MIGHKTRTRTSHLLVVLLVSVFSLHSSADGSWPQQESGAKVAGFTEAGIEMLDTAMRKLLNHTAGFGSGLLGDAPVNRAFSERDAHASSDLDEHIDEVGDIPLLA